MPTASEFTDNLAAYLRGDSEAASPMIGVFSDEIGRYLRCQLRASGLRRFAETVDLQQSVNLRVLTHLRKDENKITSPEELVKFAIEVAGNRMVDLVRRYKTQRRDVNRETALGSDSAMVVRPTGRQRRGSPEFIENKLRFDEVAAKMDPQRATLVADWLEGYNYDEIAARHDLKNGDAARYLIQQEINRLKALFARDLNA